MRGCIQCLLCYKNPDDGWGHGLEHDLKCPQSNPLALEFLLAVLRDNAIPAGELLDGTAQWVERNQNEDGSLKNPDTLLDYPHAPWWNEGGQTAPDSISGKPVLSVAEVLLKFGAATPALMAATQKWALKNLTLEKN